MTKSVILTAIMAFKKLKNLSFFQSKPNSYAVK